MVIFIQGYSKELTLTTIKGDFDILLSVDNEVKVWLNKEQTLLLIKGLNECLEDISKNTD